MSLNLEVRVAQTNFRVGEAVTLDMFVYLPVGLSNLYHMDFRPLLPAMAELLTLRVGKTVRLQS